MMYDRFPIDDVGGYERVCNQSPNYGRVASKQT